MTENSSLLHLYHFYYFLVKCLVVENFLPVSQISFYKTAIIFQYYRIFLDLYYFCCLLIKSLVTSHVFQIVFKSDAIFIQFG